MNNEYKTIPFAEVKIGQEFECADGAYRITDWPFTKVSESKWRCGESSINNFSAIHFRRGCLVRTADCEPELDTCTWTYKEYAWESACGAEFIFTEEQDSLELNRFKFCHECGCKIVEAK